ncbi:MAG TPA: hypothetical protein VHS58_19575 [Acetobacteraceae bacterium]|jgi:hypothetical protein|nr:hypothetical protein [Acetobacteraceae bacterium]
MQTGWSWGRLASRRLATGVALGAALLAQSCAQPPPPVSTARRFASDLTGGAKNCVVPKEIRLAAGKPADVKMVVGNDGGWCAISVSQSSGKPFGAGLVTAPPAHGSVYIHTVGDVTRIDYTPAPHYAGADAFTVQLVPGNPAIQTAVTVNPA